MRVATDTHNGVEMTVSMILLIVHEEDLCGKSFTVCRL